MLEKSEVEQLDKAWGIIRIVWGAMIGSLCVYVLVCKILEGQMGPADPGIPVETLKTVLLMVSIATVFAAGLLRKTLLKVDGGPSSLVVRNPSNQMQHPAAGKYLSAIIVAMALSESIGIYGLVLFILARDSLTLYEFIAFSAIAMFYYRPRKDELLQLAEGMKKRQGVERM